MLFLLDFKTLGALPPNPRHFEKWTNFNFLTVKVLVKLFQKLAGVWGQSPQGLDFTHVI